jgi:hypothetical protein
MLKKKNRTKCEANEPQASPIPATVSEPNAPRLWCQQTNLKTPPRPCENNLDIFQVPTAERAWNPSPLLEPSL